MMLPLEQRPIIDTRSEHDFLELHLEGSVSIPVSQLFMRMQELPKRTTALILVVDQSERSEVLAFFNQRSLIISDILEWQTIVNQSTFKFESGKANCFFWQPAPFVKRCYQDYFSSYLPPKSQILDVACGSGRDAIYLAMQGYDLYALDYSTTALERCALTARYHDVQLNLLQCDIENEAWLHSLPSLPQAFSAVVVCRYLHRPLLPQLKALIAPGGFLAYQTFMQGAERIGSPKNPRFLLKPGELASHFNDFDILIDDVEHLDDGRPLSRFLARRPLSA
jgi:SAM-dependent methyltransferase